MGEGAGVLVMESLEHAQNRCTPCAGLHWGFHLLAEASDAAFFFAGHKQGEIPSSAGLSCFLLGCWQTLHGSASLGPSHCSFLPGRQK